MKLTIIALALTTLYATALADLQNTTREFNLKTVLKPNQQGKEDFADLYLSSYHTGAGLSDAVLLPNPDNAIKGFLNATNGTDYSDMLFDLGIDYPYFLDMQINTNFYAAWEPVGVDVGSEDGVPSGFWINGTGLQWTSTPTMPRDYKYNQFGGWLVCDWWHGVPQLFFRVAYYTTEDYPAPASCADVYLMPDHCDGL